MKEEKKKCPLCPKKYQSYNDLKEHAKKIHDLDEAGLEYHGYRKIIFKGLYQGK